MIDEVKWRAAVLKAALLDQENVLDVLLDIADKDFLEALLVNNESHYVKLFSEKIHAISMMRKLIARGIIFDHFSRDGNSLYGCLLNFAYLDFFSLDQRNTIMENTLAFVSYLKNELNYIPAPSAVLKDLSKLAKLGDLGLNLLAAVYEFPHNDAEKIGTQYWYEAISPCDENRFHWGSPGFLKTYQFLHNKGIPLASLKNEFQQNLLHLLFKHQHYEAIHQKFCSTFTPVDDYFGDMIKLLVQVGVDPNAKDNAGKTPFDYAKENDQQAEIREWATMLTGPVNKDVKFELDIAPVPPHISSEVVSFTQTNSPNASLKLVVTRNPQNK